ncbi:cupin domain-containing protein [Caldinitratiruptor microaerophilus]|uniref:Cupin n=1 Tax=Caldinitratiruptor microaerophilus TaxID=671077 RepID=A0AA35CNF4_9FIRM|nr:cupin domain-containing protein [Caldinitratiruptor microaerophilus]BDG61618.1 cupin [Caldinitratiruptor microaerophilus]
MPFADSRAARRFDPDKYQKVTLLATERSAVDVYCLLPGQSQRLHTHAETDKYYVILEGEARVRIGEEERVLGPGWAALAGPGVPHAIANDGPGPAVVLVFQAPKAYG